MISPPVGVYEYRAARTAERAEKYTGNGCEAMAGFANARANQAKRLAETVRRWAMMEHIPHDKRPGKPTSDPYNNIMPLIAPEPATAIGTA